MAETSSQPQAGELPQPFAEWFRMIEDAKLVLDSVLLCGPSNPSQCVVGGSLSFVTCRVFSVQIGYGVLHGKDEGVVEYDLEHVHAIGTLVENLLEPGPHCMEITSSPEGLSQVLRLCRICSEICGKILRWLAQEAMDSRSMEQPEEHERAGPRPASAANPTLREAWGMDAPEDLGLPTNHHARQNLAAIAPSVVVANRDPSRIEGA